MFITIDLQWPKLVQINIIHKAKPCLITGRWKIQSQFLYFRLTTASDTSIKGKS